MAALGLELGLGACGELADAEFFSFENLTHSLSTSFTIIDIFSFIHSLFSPREHIS